ncbi:MAG: response regulator [Myxococcales bacterium]
MSRNDSGSHDTLDLIQLLTVLTSFNKGDFTARMPVTHIGLAGKIADTLNEILEREERLGQELHRVSVAVGQDGQISQRIKVDNLSGAWGITANAINGLVSDLVQPTTEVARVIGAVAKGDLSQTMALDIEGRPLKGELLRTATIVNGMVQQLGSFSAEVTRVAREVGTEGKLGGQAIAEGVAGTWKDLTDSVNSMAGNLTAQVRNIADVTTAVANGDLSKKITVDVRGEFLQLKDTINTMVDQLRAFSLEVTRVAREVGTDGKLGGQASVPGAAGIWRNLTDNVNQLAANLTSQVRAITEISTAVMKGDLTRLITVPAAGEVAALKDNVNQMIRNLQETTRRNAEQDWLKTNLAKLTRLLQGQRDTLGVSGCLLSEVAPLTGAQHGAFYIAESDSEGEQSAEAHAFKLLRGYAYKDRKGLSNRFMLGEGLVGQCAVEKERILITNAPADYIQISSGLGDAKPQSIVVLPVVFEGQVKAVVELASFGHFSEIQLRFLEQLADSIGIMLNTITTSMRTEGLLKQSRALTQELTETNKRLETQARSLQQSEEKLKEQTQELQVANEELVLRAQLLTQQNGEVERKNWEVERARDLLQEKAAQLAMTSRYKSEFLANMSHELRTPLNSLLILSKVLAENADKNLTDKQIEYAKTVHASGSDLLDLINDILDLSKIESGTVVVEPADVPLAAVCDTMEQSFRPVATTKSLGFAIELAKELPAAISTDARRLQQILKNLLSNAFKFTERGEVRLIVRPATSGWSEDRETLNRAGQAVAFAVKDTGIDIPEAKHQIIFEAFQQADGTTSRKYGGTGLGLSISREIARMLGGEMQLESEVGKGSTFTLYLPLSYTAPSRRFPSTGSAVLRTAQAPMDDRGAIQPGEQVLLIVEDDPAFRQILLEMARYRGFKCLLAESADSALRLVQDFRVDAITLDLRLPDRDGWTVLDRLKQDPNTRHIPVHIISVEEERRGLEHGAIGHLRKPATKEAVDAALCRLLDETALFLHRVEIKLHEPKPRLLDPMSKGNEELPGRKVLVVDDDFRNIFALTGALEGRGMQVCHAESGRDALALLNKGQEVDVVLMDIMMPEMDGYETIREIRKVGKLERLPIIALTAKAMRGDREKCLDAGASDYIAKPVDMDQLLLLLRTWLR